MPLMLCDKAQKSYGGVKALGGVSLVIEKGETVGVIGSNGAGKTTLFQVLTAYERPDSGYAAVTLPSGEAVTAHVLGPYRLARLGVGRTFQNLRLFEGLTPRENLLAAIYSMNIKEIDPDRLLLELSLTSYADMVVSSLPYGARKLTELARAVTVAASGLGLLFLDEPCAGLNEGETAELSLRLSGLKRRYGLTIFFVEHHMSFVREQSDRLYAMDEGLVIASGSPRAVLCDTRVKELILGEE